jgi:hypothetical protein
MNERTKSANIHIPTSILYEDFTKWFIVGNPNIKNIPSNKEFIKELRNIGYEKQIIKYKNANRVNGYKNIILIE